MKNLLICFILLIGLSVFAEETEKQVQAPVPVESTPSAEPETAKPADTKPAAEELLSKASPFRKETLARINEILSEIEKNYPVAVAKYTQADEEKTIKSLVTSLNSGIEYLAAGTEVPEEPKKDIKALQAIIISSQKILYIRIDAFTPETYSRLKEDCENTARLANKPVGLLLDLRDCQGYDYENCLRAVSLFCSPDKVPKVEGLEMPKRVLNIPVIVLVGNKTKGSGEIFTRLMSESGQCLISGGSTSGTPFVKTKVSLKSGSILLVPSVPDYFSNIPASQIVPATSVTPYPQIAYDKLSTTAGSEESDKCLMRAIDLLICLEALHKEQKKRENPKPK